MTKDEMRASATLTQCAADAAIHQGKYLLACAVVEPGLTRVLLFDPHRTEYIVTSHRPEWGNDFGSGRYRHNAGQAWTEYIEQITAMQEGAAA